MSQQTPPLLEFAFPHFVGGVVAKYPTWLNPLGKLLKMQNCESSKGYLRSRNGITLMGTVAGSRPVKSIFRAYKSDPAEVKVTVVTAGSFIYKLTGSTFSSIATVSTPNLYWDFSIMNSTLWATDGMDVMRKWDMSAASMSVMAAHPPERPLFVRPWRNRLIAYAFPRYANRVHYTNPMDQGGTEYWASASYFTVPEDGSGREITGGAELGDEYVFLTENSISIVTGDDIADANVQTLYHNCDGCRGKRTVVSFGNWIVWLGMKGVWLFAGSAPELISDDIEEVIDDINRTYIQNAVASRVGNQYWLSYCSTSATGTTNNRIIVYDFANKAWYGPYTLSMDSLTVYTGVGDQWEVCGGSSASDGKVYRLNYGNTDNATTIPIIADMAWIDFGDPYKRKQLYDITLLASPATGNVTVSYALDHSTSYTALKTDMSLATTGENEGDWDTTSVTGRTLVAYPIRFPDNVVCRFVSIRISGDRSVPCNVYGIKIRANPTMIYV